MLLPHVYNRNKENKEDCGITECEHTEEHALARTVPGCCTRFRSRRAAEPCTEPPAGERRCSGSGDEAFSWFSLPHSKAKRSRCLRGRCVGYASLMSPAREMSCYMTGRTVDTPLMNARASLDQFNHIAADISSVSFDNIPHTMRYHNNGSCRTYFS